MRAWKKSRNQTLHCEGVSMWLARVRSRTSGTGDLVIFRTRPQLVSGGWYPAGSSYGGWNALIWWTATDPAPDPYPGLTVENSPIEIFIMVRGGAKFRKQRAGMRKCSQCGESYWHRAYLICPGCRVNKEES